MNTRPLMVLHLTTAAIEDVGSTPRGRLFIFPILGGSFEGDRVRGKVLAGGADWATATADGAFELDLRATLETDDGALIYLTFTGVRDDARQDPAHPASLRDSRSPVRLPQSPARCGYWRNPSRRAGAHHRRAALAESPLVSVRRHQPMSSEAILSPSSRKM